MLYYSLEITCGSRARTNSNCPTEIWSASLRFLQTKIISSKFGQSAAIAFILDNEQMLTGPSLHKER